jgi:hypothetical protein
LTRGDETQLNTAVAMSFLLLLLLLLFDAINGDDFVTQIPIVKINTFGQSIEELSRIRASLEIVWQSGNQSNSFNDIVPMNDRSWSGYVDIWLHGYASLHTKKPSYNIKTFTFRTDTDATKQPLMTFPASKRFVIYGPREGTKTVSLSRRRQNSMTVSNRCMSELFSFVVLEQVWIHHI